MELFTRMQHALKRLCSSRAERVDEPAIILTEYRRAMERGLAKSSTRFHVAITLCIYLGRLLQERQDEVRRRERDRAETDTAKRRLRRKKPSRRLERELESLDPNLAKLRRALEGAQTDYAVIAQTRRAFELPVRQRTADRLAKLGWKPARIEAALNKEILRLPLRGSWEAACAKERARRMVRAWDDDSSTGEAETTGLSNRTWHVLKRLLTRGAKAAKDPETLAWEATKSMRRKLERAKEDAVQVLRRRSDLRNRLQECQKQVLATGPDVVDAEIVELQQALEQAEQKADAARRGIVALDAQIRRRAAQRQAWAEWTQESFQEEIKVVISQWLQGDERGGPSEPEPTDESSTGSADV